MPGILYCRHRERGDPVNIDSAVISRTMTDEVRDGAKHMPKTLLLVRAVVAAPLREKFDRWYSSDHLPWACRVFKCAKAWRFWSAVEEGVHYAVYAFADKAACDAALGTAEFTQMIADFNRAWPDGVTRTRDIVTLAEERGA
jgi:hypothetical protein